MEDLTEQQITQLNDIIKKIDAEVQSGLPHKTAIISTAEIEIQFEDQPQYSKEKIIVEWTDGSTNSEYDAFLGAILNFESRLIDQGYMTRIIDDLTIGITIE